MVAREWVGVVGERLFVTFPAIPFAVATPSPLRQLLLPCRHSDVGALPRGKLADGVSAHVQAKNAGARHSTLQPSTSTLRAWTLKRATQEG
jgi:hypothetical protein